MPETWIRLAPHLPPPHSVTDYLDCKNHTLVGDLCQDVENECIACVKSGHKD